MVKRLVAEAFVILLGLLVLGLAVASPETLAPAAEPVLSWPSFGESLSSGGGFGRGAGSSAGNRSIELQARLSF